MDDLKKWETNKLLELIKVTRPYHAHLFYPIYSNETEKEIHQAALKELKERITKKDNE